METRVARYSVRIGMIAFWLVVLFGSFYAPYLGQLFKDNQSITVFCWPSMLDPDTVADFEKETGIKVYLNYFESNDELIAKLQISQGEGYDLITPTDFMVERLVQKGLLQKIDARQLNFWDELNPSLMGHYFDPKNNYSIPFLWGILGIGIDADYFKETPQASWRLIFERMSPEYVVGMSNNARDAILVAAQYLFGSIDNLTPERLEKIKQLLLTQKKMVEAYTDLRADFLLQSHTCPAVVVASSEIWRSMRFNQSIDFLIPQEGGFLVVDSFALSAATKKQALVYKFLNYLYKPEILAHQIDKYSYFAPTKPGYLPAGSHKARRDLSLLTADQVKKLDFLRPVLSEATINDIWLAVKSY